MRTVYEYNLFGAKQILRVDHPAVADEIDSVISEVDLSRAKPETQGLRATRTMCCAEEARRLFRRLLESRGYQEARSEYQIPINAGNCRVLIPSFDAISFAKGRVLIEVQFGDRAAMFHDLAKFESFIADGKADVGVEIVPCHALHKQMSTGVSYGEQLVYDIERLKRHFPAVPIKIILIDA